MSLKRTGVLAAVLFAAASASACSTAPDSGGPTNIADANVTSEAAGSIAPRPDAQSTPTGSTGHPCTSKSDCASPDNDTCSNSYTLATPIAGITGSVLPAPLCLPAPTGDDCDPAPPLDPHGNLPHFCDGPDDPSSPGLCVPDNPLQPESGMGVCQPKCAFDVNGATQVGCPAPDTCTFSIFAQLTSGVSGSVLGFGYCQGTCQRDADCTAFGAASVCQTDVGICTSEPITRTLAIGDGCTTADFMSGACNCDYDLNTGVGFCTTTCVVGGTPCPAGWVCDTGEPSAFNLGNGNVTVMTQTAGLSGICLPSCSASSGVVVSSGVVAVDAGSPDGASDGGTDANVAGDGASDASHPLSACPGSSSCTSGTVAGPDCLP